MMKRFEVCYFVKERPYDEGQWETYAECDTLDEAEEKYAEMKAVVHPGDHIEDDKHYIDTVAIYERDATGTQNLVTSDF